jgi:hypothetical protein
MMGLRSAALPVALISFIPLAVIASPHAAAAGSTVTYQADSDGSLSTVTYFDGMDDEKQISDVSAPWTMTFTNQATYPIYGLGAQTTGLHVACQIAVNGQVRDQKSATGRYAVVNCNAAA